MSLFHVMVLFCDGCDHLYDNEFYVWMYDDKDCFMAVGFWLDLVQGIVLFTLVFVINSVTLLALRRTNTVRSDATL